MITGIVKFKEKQIKSHTKNRVHKTFHATTRLYKDAWKQYSTLLYDPKNVSITEELIQAMETKNQESLWDIEEDPGSAAR
jgi:hypothetical protein